MSEGKNKVIAFFKSTRGLIISTLSFIGTIIPVYKFFISDLRKPPKLDGKWTIIFKVEKSSYSAYINEQYVYEVYVTQNGDMIKGRGEQILYNDKIRVSVKYC